MHDKAVLPPPVASPCACVLRRPGMFPAAPSAPVAKGVGSKPTQVCVRFQAPRCNGAEVFEYDVWRVRVRGGTDDPDASDSDPDEQLHPDLHDTKLVNVYSGIPDECTRKQAYITSGHSQDHVRVVLEGLRPGSRHRVQLRARNTRGFGPFAPLSNIAKCSSRCLLPVTAFRSTAPLYTQACAVAVRARRPVLLAQCILPTPCQAHASHQPCVPAPKCTSLPPNPSPLPTCLQPSPPASRQR
jgi:hypothetical protein